MAVWTVLHRPPKLSYDGWNWRRVGIPVTGTEHPTTAPLSFAKTGTAAASAPICPYSKLVLRSHCPDLHATCVYSRSSVRHAHLNSSLEHIFGAIHLEGLDRMGQDPSSCCMNSCR